MKNKKGFVFVETIVVCAVLAISLVTIYASFVLLVNDQKKRNKYDTAIYNYRLYNVAKELNDSLGHDCSSYEAIDSTLKNDYNIESLYFVKARNINDGVPGNYNHLAEYIKTISTNDAEDCVLIGEFKANNTANGKDEYYYSNVIIESKG